MSSVTPSRITGPGGYGSWVNVRTCVGCRERDAPGPVDDPAMIRLAWQGASQTVMADVRRRAPGRGGWIHPRQGCIDQTLKKRAVNRALRRRVEDAQLTQVLNRLLAGSAP